MRVFLIFLVFATANLCHGQIIIDTVYFDSNWRVIQKPDPTGYYRVIATDNTLSSRMLVKDYYMTDTLQMSGYFTSINPDNRQGQFIYYYTDGKVQTLAEFDNDKLNGKRETFYENGLNKSLEFYSKGKRDSTCTYYNSDGNILKKVDYKGGLKQGLFSTFYENGNVRRKDYYENDTLSHGNCYNKNGGDTTWNSYFTEPKFQEGGLEKFKHFILENLKFPKEASKLDISGKVLVKFTISTFGDITNIKLVRDDKEFFNSEVLRVLNSAPKWQPGSCEGKNIEVTYYIPLKFEK